MATPTNDKNSSSSFPPPQNPPPSAAASHPYAYHPPPFYQQPATILTYQQPQSAAKSFLCCFLSFITAIVAILFITVTIRYFILKPRFPEFRVNSATLTSLNFNSNNSGLTAKWDISLIVSNPNKKLEITYNAIAAGIFYGNELELLSSTQLAPFNQPKQSTNVMGVQFQILNEYIDNSVANGIADGRLRGFMQFGMVLKVLIKLNGLFHPNDFLLKVTCAPLNFGMSNNTNNVTWVLFSGLDCSI